MRVWGSYDAGDKREIKLQEEQEAQRNGNEDLLDLAAVQTYLNGGKVFAVDQQEVPEGYAAGGDLPVLKREKGHKGQQGQQEALFSCP